MRIVVLISADVEWVATKRLLAPVELVRSPYGEVFTHSVAGQSVVVLHGGWGKVAAAASTEYAISQWAPDLLLNLGTCGGIEGKVTRGEIILVNTTTICDIYEAMGDSAEAIDAYSTTIDLDWLDESFPIPVRRAGLLSADRDLVPPIVPNVVERYGAVAADWESGAIAYVASRRQRRLVILRGVSDLVNPARGDITGDLAGFQSRAADVMATLLSGLPTLVPYVLERLPTDRLSGMLESPPPTW